MVAHVATVAFLGLEARAVEVQVQVAAGLPAFIVVGLADKAVAESRERGEGGVGHDRTGAPTQAHHRQSFSRRSVERGLLGAMGVVDAETLASSLVIGELGLDGRVASAPGALLAALHASERELGLICPERTGAEAAWAGSIEVIAAPDLLSLLNHLRGLGALTPPKAGIVETEQSVPDLRQVKGQEAPKRAPEIAAAGAHNLLFVGPPGAANR